MTAEAEVYQAPRQEKPWGHEQIFAAMDGKYVGKIIYVDTGQSLSLQRRGAVLRWVRGWYAEQGITNIPEAALHLPVIDPRWTSRISPAESPAMTAPATS